MGQSWLKELRSLTALHEFASSNMKCPGYETTPDQSG